MRPGETGDHFKQMVFEQSGIPASEQCLVCDGREFAARENAMVHVTFRLCGGSAISYAMPDLCILRRCTTKIHRFGPGAPGAKMMTGDRCARFKHWSLLLTGRSKKDQLTHISLHEACRAGRIDVLRALVTTYGMDVNCADECGWTALHIAMARNDVETVVALLELGARNEAAVDGLLPSALNPELWDERGCSVHSRQCTASPSLSRRQSGAAPSSPCDPSFNRAELWRKLKGLCDYSVLTQISPSHVAAYCREIYTDSRKYGAALFDRLQVDWGYPRSTPAWEEHCEWPVLLASARAGCVSGVCVCLELGADVDVKNTAGTTALYLSCASGYTLCAGRLLLAGADVHARTSTGRTPLHAALDGRHLDIVTRLLEHGADPNQLLAESHSAVGCIPLYTACHNGDTELATLLINHGADVNSAMSSGYTALFVACQKKQDACVLLLLQSGADANRGYSDGWFSPLFVGCQNGSVTSVRMLLDYGADVDGGVSVEQPVPGFVTPLCYASRHGFLECVELLLERGANPDFLSWDQMSSPLLFASHAGHAECVNALLEAGATADIAWGSGVTPLQYACQEGHLDCARVLVQHGANVNHVMLGDGTGISSSPLFVATQAGHREIVQLLLEHGASPNLPLGENVAPLFIACQSGRTECIPILLTHGASTQVEGGTTALHEACHYGQRRAALSLLEHATDLDVARVDSDGKTAAEICREETFDEDLARGLDLFQEDRESGLSHLRMLLGIS